MNSQLDNWLRELDPNALLKEIAELREESARIEREVTKREQALKLISQWAPDRVPHHERAEEEHAPVARTDEPRFPVGDQPPIEPDEAAEMDADEAPAGFETVSDMSEKRRALFAYLADAPSGLHLRDIRARIREDRLHFTGTPVRAILWRAAQTGEVESAGKGIYRLRRPTGDSPHRSPIRRSAFE